MLLPEKFSLTVERCGGRPALRADGIAWSYDELNLRVQLLAEQLDDLGVGPGERVAIDLGNRAAAVVAIWATLRVGAAFACLDSTTPALGWSGLIRDFSPRVAFTRRSRLAAAELPGETIPLVDAAEPGEGADGFQLFDFEGLPTGRNFTLPTDMSTSPANLVYTSGSTGEPKGVVMSHAAVSWAAEAIGSYLKLDAEDVVLNVLPLSFDYGLYQVLLCGGAGACLVLEQGMGYPGRLLETLRDQRVTTIPGVPSLFQMLMQRSSFDAHRLPALRRFTNTGAHLSSGAVRGIRRRFPTAELYLMYGLTECKRVSYLPPDKVDLHPDSVGIPMPGCEVAIVDGEGRPLESNRVGELVVRSRSMMTGYWGKEEETERVLRPGPWRGERVLWTGDLFLRDGAGLLYFVGRMDDVFKSRGEKVAPIEVERALCEHDAVAEAAVVPAPDPTLGSRIHAFVVHVEGHSPEERDLKRHCSERLEPLKLPHRISALSELPRNARGKVDRAALIALASTEEASTPPGRT